MGRIAALLLLALLFAATTSETALADNEQPGIAHNVLRNEDFSEELGKLGIITRSMLEEQFDEMDDRLRTKVRQRVENVSYAIEQAGGPTQGEELVLGYWPSDLEHKNNVISRQIGAVVKFYGEHGRLPKEGIELFPGLYSVMEFEEYWEMSQQEKVLNYFEGINFLTGRFYESYDNPEWKPGSIHAEIVDAEDFKPGWVNDLPAEQQAALADQHPFGLRLTMWAESAPVALIEVTVGLHPETVAAAQSGHTKAE